MVRQGATGTTEPARGAKVLKKVESWLLVSKGKAPKGKPPSASFSPTILILLCFWFWVRLTSIIIKNFLIPLQIIRVITIAKGPTILISALFLVLARASPDY